MWVWPVGPRRVGEEVDQEVVRNRPREAAVRRSQPVEVRTGNTGRAGEEEHRTARVVGNEPEHHRAVEEVHRTVPAAARVVVGHKLVGAVDKRCMKHVAEVHHTEIADDAAEEEAVGNIRLPVVEGVLGGPRLAVIT